MNNEMPSQFTYQLDKNKKSGYSAYENKYALGVFYY